MRKIAALSKNNDNFLNKLDQLKNKNGKLTQTSEDTLNTLADELIKEDISVEPIKTSHNEENQNIINDIINKKQCQKAIKNFQKNKSPGPDGIRYEMHTPGNSLKNQLSGLLKNVSNMDIAPRAG